MVETGSIRPDHFWGDTEIPVFKPSMEQFRDFSAFIAKVDHYGIQSGIIKIIPPKEWLDDLPDLATKCASIAVKNPIEQHISGGNGCFRQMNVEKKKICSLREWKDICFRSEHLPPAKRGQLRGNANSTLNNNSLNVDKTMTDQPFTDYNADNLDEFTPERIEELEKVYWKTITFNSPMYGADMSGSLFDKDIDVWNVASLDNPLNYLKSKIPGVNTPYLYLGMWKATFSWHLEDMDLYSINYLHFGAPKYWYSISHRDMPKFEELMRNTFSGDAIACDQFLRHKTFWVSPAFLASHGIKVNRLVHFEKEFVITFPFGYHAGFNMGYNCAESVNFATPRWFRIGLNAKKCLCISDAVTIDVLGIVRELKENNYDVSSFGIPINDTLLEPTKTLISKNSKSRSRKDTKKSSLKKANGKHTNVKSDDRKNAKRPRHKGPLRVEKPIVPKSSRVCILCPNKILYEAMVPIEGYKSVFAHLSCILLIPETSVELAQKNRSSTSWQAIGLDLIDPERFKLKCSHCKSMKGACFQCSDPTCIRTFHGTCAAPSGVYIERLNDDDGYFGPRHLCKRHRPDLRTEETSMKKGQFDTDKKHSGHDNNVFCEHINPGTIVQARAVNGDWFSGQVITNNRSEDTLTLRNWREDIVEVAYSFIIPAKCDLITEHSRLAKLGYRHVAGNQEMLPVKRRKDIYVQMASSLSKTDLPPVGPESIVHNSLEI